MRPNKAKITRKITVQKLYKDSTVILGVRLQTKIKRKHEENRKVAADKNNTTKHSLGDDNRGTYAKQNENTKNQFLCGLVRA